MTDKSPRIAVLEMLSRMSGNAYSNLVLDSVLSDSEYSRQEKNFISRLFYGIIERQLTLDHIISMYSSKPLQKLDKDILLVLRIGIYQLVYMDSVPDNAAVNESVNMVKLRGKQSASGFVNAVLRNFIRDNKVIKYPEKTDERLSIMYSCSKELTARLLEQYDEKTVADFLMASVETHKLYLRVNNTKITSEELINKFSELNIKAEKNKYEDNCLEVEAFGAIEECSLFKEGYYHVQDLSSQLCCKALNPQRKERILDICAAPGGKTFTIAEMTNDDCELFSCDLHSKRVKLIESGAERLGLASITPLQNDAKEYNENLGTFDKILCDVPCSGFGVIRSKPEIKYTKLSEIERLPQIQYDILETAAKYLKVGGELVYSTCTVIKDENDFVIDRFLKENNDFEGVNFLNDIGKPFGSYKAVIFPSDLNCEGFFISKVKRIK